MLAGGRTLHPSPSKLSHTTKYLMSGPWPTRSRRWLREASPGPKQISQSPRTGEGKARSWMWRQLLKTNRKCFRETTGLKLRTLQCTFRQLCSPTKAPTELPWAGQSASPRWSGDTVVLKSKYILQIIPELFNPVYFHRTQRDFYLWLSTWEEIYFLTGHLVPLSPCRQRSFLQIHLATTYPSPLHVRTSKTEELGLEQYFSD